MKFLGERYGVVREWLKSFTRDGSWRLTRTQFIDRFSVCECCGSIKELNVHHTFPVRWFPEFELNPYNLITLCRKHHFYYGHLGNWKKWNPEIWRMAQLFQKGKEAFDYDYNRFKVLGEEPDYDKYIKEVKKASGKFIQQGKGYVTRK